MNLVIKLPPEASRSPNKTMGRSFWVYKNHKDKCEKMLVSWEGGLSEDMESDRCLFTNAVDKHKSLVHLNICGYGCRPKDCDNLVAGCKAIIDILRKRGYIIDDNPQKMTLSVESRKVNSRSLEGVVLTLSIQDE